MKSVMQHQFAQVPQVSNPRSRFDRKSGYKTTFNSGYLYPMFFDEVLPGDTHFLRTACMARLATPLFPVMDNMFLDTFYFFVPYRLIWSNFQKMMGEQANPGDSTDYLFPIIDFTEYAGFPALSLYDYFGLPVGIPNLTVNSSFLRAYNLIWNTWFRDQNMQNSVTVPLDDGPDDPALYQLLRRGKRHDYFTSCLPWPQKGPGVELPLGTTAPVKGNGMSLGFTDGTTNAAVYDFAGVGWSAHTGGYGQPVGTAWDSSGGVTSAVTLGLTTDPTKSGMVADLSAATAATINSLRQAIQLQAFYERDARGGTRYIEILKSHFGVVSPDARLQRPEYLGGGETPVQIHVVASTADIGQTSGDPTIAGTGDLRGFGTATFMNHGFHKSFVEHGVIIGLMSVRADINYQQGLDKMWSRRDRLDFYWPSFAGIGEQAVLNQEIYAQGTSDDSGVFGYQERYGEYRFKRSIVTGEFRSTYPTSLDTWHLALDFTSLPHLNASFIEDKPPIDRVVRITSEPQFIGDFLHQLTSVRAMPLYGVPASLLRM